VLSEFAKRNRLYSRGIEKSLKFIPCNKLGRSKASIPQIVFQAIVASFCPRKPAFLRPKTRGIVAKNHTALNKPKENECKHSPFYILAKTLQVEEQKEISIIYRKFLLIILSVQISCWQKTNLTFQKWKIQFKFRFVFCQYVFGQKH